MKKLTLKTPLLILSVAAAMSLTACGTELEKKAADTILPNPTPAEPAPLPLPIDPEPVPEPAPTPIEPVTMVDDYTFASKFIDGKSAVSYTGQVARHALIADMATKFKSYVRNVDAASNPVVADDMKVFMEGPTEDLLLDLSKISSKAGTKPLVKGGDVIATVGDISGGKSLEGKLAGNDKESHVTDFTGFLGAETPTDVVYEMMDMVQSEMNTMAMIPTKEEGDQEITKSYVDINGRDFNQLAQKYLLMAVAFNQGTSDYLLTDWADKNTEKTKDGVGKGYTGAEHAWDEAFGYFGASRDYNNLTDKQIKGIVSDTNKDGKIDLTSEVNQGAAVNCAKRDDGSADNTNPTNFTKDAFDAFLAGRQILSDAAGTVGMTAEQVTAVEGHAAKAAATWEKCIAATVVHYINDTHDDLQGFIDNDGKFATLEAYEEFAKHWSELAGFAVGLQFNVNSPIYTSMQTGGLYRDMILNTIGDKPSFGSVEEAEQYRAGLMDARDILQDMYGFDQENVEKW